MEWHILNRKNAKKFADDLPDWVGLQIGHDEGYLMVRFRIASTQLKEYLPPQPEDLLPALAKKISALACEPDIQKDIQGAFELIDNRLKKLEKK